MNDVSSDWVQTIESTEGAADRFVSISPVSDTWVDGWYRAKPAGGTGGMKCADVDGNPDAVYDIDYPGTNPDAIDDYFYFRVLTYSLFDLNQNFAVDAPDAAEWLSSPVDFDGDQDADGADFQLLMDNMD